MKLTDLENKKLDGNQVIYLMHNIKNGHYIDEPIMELHINCNDGESLMTIAEDLISKGVDILGLKNYWFAVKDSNGQYIPPKIKNLDRRNIVVVSNIPEEDAVAWEFDFYFKNDLELFEKSVCDKVDPSLIKKSTCSNELKTDDPDYYIVIKLSDEVKADLLTKWEQFCTDNNVHVIGI